MAYDNTNTGILGKNDRKETDKHPDITGSINVDGVEYFLDGWQRERKDGSGKFYSLRVKRKDKQPEPGNNDRGASRESHQRPLDDYENLPF